jgi:GNAT superfamily N-acetyltransferase
LELRAARSDRLRSPGDLGGLTWGWPRDIGTRGEQFRLAGRPAIELERDRPSAAARVIIERFPNGQVGHELSGAAPCQATHRDHRKSQGAERCGKVVSVGIRFVTVRDRPDLLGRMWELPNPWPTFMQQDVVADFTYDLMPVRFPEYQLLAVDGDQVHGRVNAVPYAWSGADEDLPESGWDFALGMAFRPEMPEAATAVCLIEARIHPDMAGAGLGTDLLLAARENAAALGYSHLLARFGGERLRRLR